MLKNFHCTRCGLCCYPPRLYKKDIKRIKDAGYEDFFQFDFRGIAYLKEKDGWCIFLQRNKKSKKTSCKIYEHRPKICRLYPSRLVKGSCIPHTLASDSLFEKWQT